MWAFGPLSSNDVDVDRAAVTAVSEMAGRIASKMVSEHVDYTLLAFGLRAESNVDVDAAAVPAVSQMARCVTSKIKFIHVTHKTLIIVRHI